MAMPLIQNIREHLQIQCVQFWTMNFVVPMGYPHRDTCRQLDIMVPKSESLVWSRTSDT